MVLVRPMKVVSPRRPSGLPGLILIFVDSFIVLFELLFMNGVLTSRDTNHLG